jgi:hypothetical protein
MNVNTLVGALVASLILFGSSLVTLFTNNPDLTFEQISTGGKPDLKSRND